jgi:YtkA-like
LAKIALFLTLLVLAFPAAAQRVRAQMDCRFTGTDFVYDCLIRLAPATPGVNITVNADMPSMPMAHNLKPVKATPGKLPGEYRARLDLDMTGEWAVKLHLSGAVRDVLVLHHRFTESGTAPRK